MDELHIREFKKSVRKVSETRKHKVNNSWGVYDAYKYIRKNKWFYIGKNVSQKDFYAIVRGVNQILAEAISEGTMVTLPEHMGTLQVRKRPVKSFIKNGKLITNRGIDWNRTIELWAQDEEAKENKTLIRHENNEVFRVWYKKWDARYKNKSFYEFLTNRALKNKISSKARKGKLDAFLLYKTKYD